MSEHKETFGNIVKLGRELPEPAYPGEFTEGEIVRYYNPERLTWRERIYLPEVFAGLRITGRHFFRNMWAWIKWVPGWLAGKGHETPKGAVTVFYPEETRPDYSPITRGKHILTLRPSGEPQCVACYMCATACPSFCIHIVAAEHSDPKIEKYPASFEIEIDKCVFCGFCQEACPVDAIRLTTDVHLADYKRERMIYDKEYLTSWRPTVVDEEKVFPGGAPRED
jgi:NADH-quinone oxidoreductase subunit I